MVSNPWIKKDKANTMRLVNAMLNPTSQTIISCMIVGIDVLFAHYYKNITKE